MFGAGVALTSCNIADIEGKQAPPRPVKLITIAEASYQSSGSFPAVVRSVRTTNLAFQVGGQIIEWNGRNGTQFRRGDVIGRLDARSFQASVARAEAQFSNAKSEFERAQRLIAEDAISRSVVEGREAQMQVAQAALDTARKNLSDTVLRAPFSGAVGRSTVEQFQNVGPQQTVLVMQSRSVEAIVNVPASFVLNSNLVRYSNVEVELDAAPGRRFAAQFRGAVGQADSSSQTFEVKFGFEPPSELVVLTGMTATFFYDVEDIALDEEERGVSVPLTAIMAEGDSRYVWIATGTDKVLERREVQTADGVGESLTVIDGLGVGDTIVAAGGAYLQAGDRVRQWQE